MQDRPFFGKPVQELEAILANNEGDMDLYDKLLHELEFRNTIKALKLKERVFELKNKAADSFSNKEEAVAQSVNTFSSSKAKANEVVNILHSWIALEVLSPQGFKKEVDLAGDTKRIAKLNNPLLPWEEDEKPLSGKKLYYEIILGAINLEPTIGALLEKYSDNRPDKPTSNQKAIIASVIVDAKGRPLEDMNSLAISSFAWGVPVALKGDLKQLALWSEEEYYLKKQLHEKLAMRDKNGEILPLKSEDIANFHTYITKTLGIEILDIIPPSFAVRHYKNSTNKTSLEPRLLNSFYLKDLILAQNLTKEGKLPKALKHYLGLASSSQKTNILDDQKGLRRILQPNLTPLGRWPSQGRFPLSLLQQVAVNGSMKDIQSSNILSVNGPPGTGKTTLLRDIIAARITDRAAVLAKYDDPKQAFIPSEQKLKRSGATIILHHLDEQLKGFEMVVASSNNKAVQNVSEELPNIDAIAEDAQDLRYFKSISDHVLETNTWGMIAAVLGNSSNCNQFIKKFWQDKDCGFSSYLNHIAGAKEFIIEKFDDGTEEKRLKKVITSEDPPNDHNEALFRWKKARASFLAELKASQQIQSSRQKIHDMLIKQEGIEAKIFEIEPKISHIHQTIEEIFVDQKDAASELKEVQSAYQNIADKLNKHQNLRPNFFARLFRTKSARIWQQEKIRILKQLAQQETDVQTHQLQLERFNQELHEQFGLLSETEKTLNSLKTNLQILSQNILDDCAQICITLPDKEFFQRSHEEKYKAALWFDKKDHRQRDRTFEAAMALHRAFIDCVADPLRQNLSIFFESMGSYSLGMKEKDLMFSDLWSSFFLVVPVVSTTFASVHRMFSRLSPEDLGWLLIDEAGQALPQAAVGAIMRSKQAVIVGDPLQIESIVSLPNTLTEEICRNFSIDSITFNAPEASAQTLADKSSPYLSRFPIGSGYRDVGSPLLVHRRCESPMFDIANDIAYANLMVQAKKPSDIFRPLGKSCWFDIVSNSDIDKYCAAEADKIIELLGILKDAKEEPDIYIATPFVAVQDNLRMQIQKSGILDGWVARNWVYEHVGTVHTVQGREAKTVFFVLGAQSPSQGGARMWAGSKPNLVNVAVTRSKTSLYVIGNRSLWKSAGVFKTLDRLLP